MDGIGSSIYMTMEQWAKRLDPNGKIATIAEMLSQENAMLKDIGFMEGNLPTGHRTVIRTGLPAVYWRLINQGVPPSTSETAQVDEQCGMLDAWSEVDKTLAELNGNLPAFRLSEAQAKFEAMAQEMASTYLYGNCGVNPEEFTGLAPRYSSASASNVTNILDGGSAVGQTDNSSIWLCGWKENKLYGIFPKGSKAGLTRSDKGLVVVQTSTTTPSTTTGGRMEAYQEHFEWKAGLCVQDWRYAVRICNIDISNLVAKSSAADLPELMIKALRRIPNLSGCNPVFYMNRTVRQMLDIQMRDDVSTGGGLTKENVDGWIQERFEGVPVRTMDAILNSEDRIAGL